MRTVSCLVDSSTKDLTPHDPTFETEHYQQDFFFTYVCRHCQRSYKTFALRLGNPVRPNLADATKIGEWPPFGPPVPSRVITLIGPDRDLFLQGRRAENQGMGIGAFAYYRRVVENQKNHIIDEIMRVVTRLGADPAMLRDLESAKSDFRFERAIEAVKLGIPEVLKINGHNPLTLLHSALSNGLHNDSDAGCLEIATSIRVVLTELAERIDSALREKKELDEAVSRLLKGNVKPKTEPQ